MHVWPRSGPRGCNSTRHDRPVGGDDVEDESPHTRQVPKDLCVVHGSAEAVVIAATFDEQRVPPRARVRAGSGLRDALTSPHDPESRRLVEPDACGILRKDAGLDGPDTGVLRGADEGIDRKSTSLNSSQ